MMWMAVQQISHSNTHSHNIAEGQRPADRVENNYNKKEREKKFQDGRPFCYYDTYRPAFGRHSLDVTQ